jgi:Clostripain family
VNIQSTKKFSAAVTRANAPAAKGEEAKEQTAAAPTRADAVEISGDSPDGKKEWTVLVWANGKANGADRLAPSVIRELEVAGSDENIDIVAQLGRKGRVYDKLTKDWSGTKRYHIQRNNNPPSTQQELMKWFLPPYTDGIVSPVLQDLGNADMGSSASLSEFLQWGMKEFPAKNYAVVIYGEGGGFVGAGVDEETHHRLTPGGIQQAFLEAKMATGEDIDLVAFDSDHMGGLETAAQLKDSAGIMVASEAGLNLGSIQLDMVMKDLKFELAEKGEVTPRQLADWFVFETRANPGPLAEMVNPTLSAIDLKKVGGVKDAYGALTEKLAAALKDQPNAKEAIRQAIGDTQAYAQNNDTNGFYGDYRDVGHFAKNLKADARLGEDVHAAAEALLKATGEAVIDQSAHGAFKANSTGLTAYLPLDAGYDLHSTWKAPRAFDPLHGYADTSVAQDSKAIEVLRGIAEEGKFNRRLRSLGLENGGIVKTHKALNVAKKVGKFALGVASNIGAIHGWSYARGNEPGGYMGIPSSVAVPLAPVGGLRRSALGLGQIVSSARNENLANKGQAIFDGSIDTVSGLAVTAASGIHISEMMGVGSEALSKFKQPAGIVAVGAPFLKTAYGMIASRKTAVKAKEEVLAMTTEQRMLNLESGEQKEYYVSPVARWLVDAVGGGAMDMSEVKA